MKLTNFYTPVKSTLLHSIPSKTPTMALNTLSTDSFVMKQRSGIDDDDIERLSRILGLRLNNSSYVQLKAFQEILGWIADPKVPDEEKEGTVDQDGYWDDIEKIWQAIFEGEVSAQHEE